MKYDAEYHANLLSRQYDLSPRGTRFMRRGMQHALQRVHEYGSRDEAVADIRRSIQPRGVGGFIVGAFFSGLLSWIAERIATYIWENWRAAEKHETELSTLRKAVESSIGPEQHFVRYG